MNFAAPLGRNSGRATPSLRRTPIAHHNENANPAGFHLLIARSCSDKLGQLSLNHTRQAISNDRQIGEAQTRAYLIVRPVAYKERTKVTDVALVNTGQSPAWNVSHITVTSRLPWPVDGEPGDLVVPIKNQLSPTNMIGAGQEVTIETSWEDRKGMPDDAKTICVYGIVHYEDVFRKIYKLRFCARWGATIVIAGHRKGMQHHFEFAKFHNDEREITQRNR